MSFFSQLGSLITPPKNSSTPSLSRVEKTRARLEDERQHGTAKDAQIRGTMQTSSARDMYTNSLGRQSPTHGTSLGRLGSAPMLGNQMPSRLMGGSMPVLPPKLPPIRFRGSRG